MHDRALRGDPLEERPPRREELLGPSRSRCLRRRAARAAPVSIQTALLLVGNERVQGVGDLAARRLTSSVSSRPHRPRTISPSAQNVRPSPCAGERPACHHVVSTRPSTYLRNSQASRLLPMPAGPMTLTSRVRASRPVAWNRSLRSRSSSSRPTNGASRPSDRPRPPTSATTRSARNALTGASLPFRTRLAGGLEDDRLRGRSLGRLAHEHGSRRRDALEARRRVHQVAGHHPLSLRPERDRRLAGQHGRARLEPGLERRDACHQLHRGADAELGIVLEGRRRAPDGHHGVADELLHRPAIAVDGLPGEVEVAGQEVARLLGVAVLREGRGADEVGEEDADESPLGDRGRCWRRLRLDGPDRCTRRGVESGAARAAEPILGVVAGATVRASRGQRRAAAATEAAVVSVIRATGRARDHVMTSSDWNLPRHQRTGCSPA